MLAIKEYSPDYYRRWNNFVEHSNNGTIFHRLDFLAYHGNKFKENEHHLMWLKGDEIIAVMPLGIFDENRKKTAKSPYGGSYGGIVTRLNTSYETSKEIVQLLVNYSRDHNIHEIIITKPIQVCYRVYSETLLFAMLENGFCFVNSDISSVVPLQNNDIQNQVFTSRSRNMARKAMSSNIVPKFNQPIEQFWELMETTFAKHNVKPSHTFDEWKWLCKQLPESVWCDVAYLDNKPVAGIGHFRINEMVDSSFYLASDPDYQEYQGLSLMIYESILNSKKEGYEFFDFGTSSVNMTGRGNIFRFKESFGAVGFFRHTLKLTFSDND